MTKSMPISQIVSSSIKLSSPSEIAGSVKIMAYMYPYGEPEKKAPYELILRTTFSEKLEEFKEGSAVYKAIQTRFLNQGEDMYVIRQSTVERQAIVKGNKSPADILDFQTITDGGFTDQVNGNNVPLVNLDFTKANPSTQGTYVLPINIDVAKKLFVVTAGYIDVSVDGTLTHLVDVDFTGYADPDTDLQGFVDDFVRYLSANITGVNVTTNRDDSTTVSIIITSDAFGQISIVNLLTAQNIPSGKVDLTNNTVGFDLSLATIDNGTNASPVRSYQDISNFLKKAYENFIGTNTIEIDFDSTESIFIRRTVNQPPTGTVNSFVNLTPPSSGTDIRDLLGWETTYEASDLSGSTVETPIQALRNFREEVGAGGFFQLAFDPSYPMDDKKEILKFSNEPTLITGTQGALCYLTEYINKANITGSLLEYCKDNNINACVCVTNSVDPQYNISDGVAGLLSNVNYETGNIKSVHLKSLVGVEGEYYGSEYETLRKYRAVLYTKTGTRNVIRDGFTTGVYLFADKTQNVTQFLYEMQTELYNYVSRATNGIRYDSTGINGGQDTLNKICNKYKLNGTINGGVALDESAKNTIRNLYRVNGEKQISQLITAGYIIKAPDLELDVTSEDKQSRILPPYNVIFTYGDFIHYFSINVTNL